MCSSMGKLGGCGTVIETGMRERECVKSET